MKICPKCNREYDDEMNYCLDDGAVLYSSSGHTLSDQTLAFGLNQGRETGNANRQTHGQRYGETAKSFKKSEQPTAVYQSKKSHLGAIIAGVIVGVSILSGVFIYTLVSRFRAAGDTNDSSTVAESTPKTVKPKISGIVTPQTTDKLKIEIGDKVKGGFDETFIKLQVTNTGDQIIQLPRISLMLYKNDLKIGNVSSEPNIKYLKPQQTIPVWVSLFSKNKDYTAARIDEDAKYTVAAKEANLLYPNVVYTDAALSSRVGTSLLNFQPYKETFYSVKGTVENREYDLLKTKIYVIFYNDKSEIVGITNTNPPDLKRNEKAEFEASMGDKKLFGVPTKFELIAIDDSRTN